MEVTEVLVPNFIYSEEFADAAKIDLSLYSSPKMAFTDDGLLVAQLPDQWWSGPALHVRQFVLEIDGGRPAPRNEKAVSFVTPPSGTVTFSSDRVVVTGIVYSRNAKDYRSKVRVRDSFLQGGLSGVVVDKVGDALWDRTVAPRLERASARRRDSGSCTLHVSQFFYVRAKTLTVESTDRTTAFTFCTEPATTSDDFRFVVHVPRLAGSSLLGLVDRLWVAILQHKSTRYEPGSRQHERLTALGATEVPTEQRNAIFNLGSTSAPLSLGPFAGLPSAD